MSTIYEEDVSWDVLRCSKRQPSMNDQLEPIQKSSDTYEIARFMPTFTRNSDRQAAQYTGKPNSAEGLTVRPKYHST